MHDSVFTFLEVAGCPFVQCLLLFLQCSCNTERLKLHRAQNICCKWKHYRCRSMVYWFVPWMGTAAAVISAPVVMKLTLLVWAYLYTNAWYNNYGIMITCNIYLQLTCTAMEAWRWLHTRCQVQSDFHNRPQVPWLRDTDTEFDIGHLVDKQGVSHFDCYENHISIIWQVFYIHPL